jgi:hypothetical protein
VRSCGSGLCVCVCVCWCYQQTPCARMRVTSTSPCTRCANVHYHRIGRDRRTGARCQMRGRGAAVSEPLAAAPGTSRAVHTAARATGGRGGSHKFQLGARAMASLVRPGCQSTRTHNSDPLSMIPLDQIALARPSAAAPQVGGPPARGSTPKLLQPGCGARHYAPGGAAPGTSRSVVPGRCISTAKRTCEWGVVRRQRQQPAGEAMAQGQLWQPMRQALLQLVQRMQPAQTSCTLMQEKEIRINVLLVVDCV